eukprot:6208869-Pleurochrysis_carterae.AAC.6
MAWILRLLRPARHNHRAIHRRARRVSNTVSPRLERVSERLACRSTWLWLLVPRADDRARGA